MGRPFDAGQDLASIANDHDRAELGGRSFFGIFQDETADGNPRGGPVFVTASVNIFDSDVDLEVTQQKTITIRGTDYFIDARQPDGRGTIKLLLSPS